jgi:hypothetical protein
MTDLTPDRVLLSEVDEGAETLALLAQNEEAFRGAVDAFRAKDGESMQLLLERLQLGGRCQLVCHWLRSKECVLLCLELSGLPPRDEQPPDVLEFAEAVAKLAGDEELLQQIVIAIEERDASLWSALVERARLQPFSHLLCHWACTVHFRTVCGVVCQKSGAARADLAAELRVAGQAIGRLAADKESFASAVQAVGASDCEGLRATLEQAALAAIGRPICEWFCSWRCVLLCVDTCRQFPIELPQRPVEEMLEFARATGRIAAERSALERLAAAVLREDTETLRRLLAELKFEPYCLQFAHWVCFLRCQIFCTCVSPPQTTGIFTHIGVLSYVNDIESHAPGSGLTDSEHRAFYSTLRLNGGVDLVDGAPLIEYRFQTLAISQDGTKLADGTTPITPATVWDNVTPALMEPTSIGAFTRLVSVPLPFPHLEIEEIEVVVNPAGAKGLAGDTFTIVPEGEGWIALPPMVPTTPMVPSTGWTFYPNGNLVNLDTVKLQAAAALDETGLIAGQTAVTPTAPTLAADVHYAIRMMTREVGDKSDGSESGTCEHIAVDNVLYDNVLHHPYWPGGPFAPSGLGEKELAVADLGIAELAASPCSDLSDSLTVQFTAAHPNLGPVSIELQGPGGPYTFELVPPAPTASGDWYGVGGDLLTSPPAPAKPAQISFAELPPCAYFLKLTVSVLLTTGESHPLPLEDYIAFCKSA